MGNMDLNEQHELLLDRFIKFLTRVNHSHGEYHTYGPLQNSGLMRHCITHICGDTVASSEELQFTQIIPCRRLSIGHARLLTLRQREQTCVMHDAPWNVRLPRRAARKLRNNFCEGVACQQGGARLDPNTPQFTATPQGVNR